MVRILLADDHPVVRAGLRQLFADTEDLRAEGEAASGDEVIEKVRAASWDVVLLDISMPGKGGLELIKDIHAQKPLLPVLVLSMHSEEHYAVQALRAGAAGYVSKQSEAKLLISAVRKVAGGGVFVSGTVADRLARELIQGPEQPPPHARLSDRELQIFKMIASGESPAEIGRKLCLSVKTVSAHKANIKKKMEFTTDMELMRYALDHRLVGVQENNDEESMG
jgi:DNA-binding NarL/FixJ family response regulator